MSERNVELARRAIAAFNARDIEALIAYFDSRCDVHSGFAAIGGAVYHGHDGLRESFRDFEQAWGEIRIEPEAYFDLGEHTISFYVLHACGRRSGVEVARPIAQVARWRDGLIVYLKPYRDREEALRDLGVSEDELEPIEP
jgi:ketosteroid isomerase-like protein